MNKIFASYLSDKLIAEHCSDENFIQKMLQVEIALAQVQARQGIIPKAAANEIEQKLSGRAIQPDDLTAGTLQNGIPVIPLLELAKKELSEQTKDYLHWGATSQDIMDTATILVTKEVLLVFEKRLRQIIKNLYHLVQKHDQTYMIARTRTQQAVPISFALKVKNWVQPLERHLTRLEQLKPRLLVVQLGGAGGNLAALEDQGWPTAQALAKKLKLGFAGIWHVQRDNFAELSAWFALVSGSLGKMAQDILLLSQTEIGEVVENAQGGGKSSTMPHKNNPVLSEAMVALSRYVAQLSGNYFQAMQHNHERDGVALALEWLSLPQMMLATGTILQHANTISQHMKVNKKAMHANLEQLNGLVFSEQASFILARHLPRKEAKQKVKMACQMVVDQGIHLAEALTKLLPEIEVDWKAQLQAKNYQGSTQQILKDKP